jgi:hypothetical protein
VDVSKSTIDRFLLGLTIASVAVLGLLLIVLVNMR